MDQTNEQQEEMESDREYYFDDYEDDLSVSNCELEGIRHTRFTDF